MIRSAGLFLTALAALQTGGLVSGPQPAWSREIIVAQADPPATQPAEEPGSAAPQTGAQGQQPESTPAAEEDGAAPSQPAPADEAAPADETQAEPGGGPATPGDALPPQTLDDPVEPQFDLSKLPFPVQRMRELLIEAAKSGDVEKLRPYIGKGDDATMLSLGGLDSDPIEFLKSLSGDGQGYEILAILEDVLQNGFVQLDPGTENAIYIWPYFYAMPLDRLTPEQRVELYRLVTHGDYEDMKSFGAYNFYRVGITPQGRWRFFVAGD
ncbi:MAG: hypothetical protein MUE79_06475 [Nitratireductor sp.]|nr:hypothetical protein [Nitratireductor sp.]